MGGKFAFGGSSTASTKAVTLGSGGFSFGLTSSSKSNSAETKTLTFGDISAAAPKSGFTFGNTNKQEPNKSGIKSSSAEKSDKVNIPDTDASRHAAKVFDGIDVKNTGSLPIADFETLLDELGEGFHGEEMEKQMKLVDPNNTKLLHRKSFVTWYCNLVDEDKDNDSHSSLDTEEREERNQELQKAEKTFNEITLRAGKKRAGVVEL